MDRAKRIFGYVDKYKEAGIRVRPGMPNYRELDKIYKKYDWSTKVYGTQHEEFPMNMPEPLGGMMRITQYVDDNLYFDLVSGRACTGILTFLNQTPVDWYSKKQSTVATATFGSEFVASKTAVERSQDLKYTLRMFGIPVDYTTYMLRDNSAVVTQSNIPHSQQAKRHHAVAYHYVQEAVANGSIKFFFIPGALNPADCLTKFLGYQVWWPFCAPSSFGWETPSSCPATRRPPRSPRLRRT